MKPPAVIVGMEANGLAVARALSQYKIPLTALAQPRWNPCCETNTCEVVYSSAWSHEGVIDDLKSIGKGLHEKAALLITKDEPVLWISESRDEIKDFYEIHLPDHAVVELLMNKRKFYELGTKESWPLPVTWIANNKDELIHLLKEIVYPCILKPQLKNSEFRKSTSKKSFFIYDERELIRVYDMVAQWEKEVVVQEWIQGGDKRIAFCLTYYDDRGEQVVSFSGRKLRQCPIRCGNTAIAEPAPKEWVEDISRLTETIWKKVGFKGLGSIEYKLRSDTNVPVIMEPTVGRTNYQSEVAVINGVNIPAIAYCHLTNQKYKPTRSEPAPVKLIDGRAEIKAAIVYWRKGELGLRQWISDRAGKKEYMIFRASDLGPFIASMRLATWAFVKKFIRIWLKAVTAPWWLIQFIRDRHEQRQIEDKIP